MEELLIKIFDTYGLLGLIGVGIATLIYLFINKKMNESQKKTADILSASLSQMTSSITTTIIDQNKSLVDKLLQNTATSEHDMVNLLSSTLEKIHQSEEEEHRKSIKRRIDIGEPIQKKLYEMMNYYHASRCSILEFHNSKENLNGLSFVWFDMHYEQKQQNVKSISLRCKDVQVSILTQVIAKIYMRNGIAIYDEAEIKDLEKLSPLLYEWLVKDLNCTSAIFIGIYDSSNNVIGLVVIEYNDAYKMPKDIIDIHDMKSRVSALSQLLEFKKTI